MHDSNFGIRNRFGWVGVLCALTVVGCSTSTPDTYGSPARSGGESAGVVSEVNPPGDIPDNQGFVNYTAPSGLFSVKVPEGWARTDSGGGVVFSDKFNSIAAETLPSRVTPTVDSVRSGEVPMIAAHTAGFVPGTVSAVNRKAGTAILVTYGAESARDAVTGKVATLSVERYEFFSGATEVALTLSAPTGSDTVDPWLVVTDSFQWSP